MPKKKKKTKLPMFIKYICITLIVLSIILLSILGIVNILPLDYFLTLVCIILIIVSILIILMINKKTRIFSSIISFLLIIIYIIGILYSLTTLGFLNNITRTNSLMNYEVIVLKDSDYNSINDLNTKEIGMVETLSSTYVNELEKVIKFTSFKKFSTEDLATSLLDKEIDALMILDSENDILEEHYPNYASKTKKIYTFSIKIKDTATIKNTDVTNSSFNVLISGIDTYGKIGSLSRSDVNMVATINPITKEIVLTSIPRDYYVDLYGKNAKDKLAHVGIYGMDTTIKTIENLLDIEINYYVKFNFTSLIKIVDAIDGIEVESPVAFSANYYDEPKDEWVNFSFKKGTNKLNGIKALAFARERKAFAEGDIRRAQNQQLILKAVLNKALSPTIITKYNKLLTSLEDTFITNLSIESIKNFIKMEIKDGGNYTINNIVLRGSSAEMYTYSYPNTKLYVMIPNEDEIKDGKSEINRVYYSKE